MSLKYEPSSEPVQEQERRDVAGALLRLETFTPNTRIVRVCTVRGTNRGTNQSRKIKESVMIYAISGLGLEYLPLSPPQTIRFRRKSEEMSSELSLQSKLSEFTLQGKSSFSKQG